MAMKSRSSRRPRWLLETLCVVFGIVGALFDVIGSLVPAKIIVPVALIAFVGFIWTAFLKIRDSRNAIQMAKQLIPTLSAVILGAYLVLLPLVYFYQDAVADRTSAFFQPWPLSVEAIQSYLSPSVESLEFTTADGLRLQGWLVKNTNEARAPLVIYYGGSGSSSTDVIGPAQQLEGWSVAILSYRGFGFSQGYPTHANVLADATLIYDALAGRPDVDPQRIVVMGYSLGTAVAIHVAVERPVIGVVLVAPFDHFTLTGVRRPILSLPLQPLMKRYFDSAARAPSVRSPVLCLIGLQDRDVPPELALRLLSQWGGETEVEVYAREDHDLLLHENRSWSDIARFLKNLVAKESL